ncbi:MAG: phage tail protein [Rhodobacterales bacterium]|nr:MAG: phage tail protein [Rhodobacterales bacterium]
MTKDADGLDDFEDQVAALETTMGGATAVAAAFDGELARMRDGLTTTNREVSVLSKGISRGLKSAFDGLVFDGLKLSDALSKLAQSMVNASYNAAITPVTKHFGGLLANGISSAFGGGTEMFAKGGSFAQGRVMPFANGGIVSGPTRFPMRGGTGLMGEAGPEAIMPLTRGANGRLGVEMSGQARPVNITMNITTPDVDGFRRSQGQIAAQMSRALGRGQRNR